MYSTYVLIMLCWKWTFHIFGSVIVWHYCGNVLWIFYLADDEDEYDEGGASNRLLGFMFGNVDGAGDLDVDYLDEAKFLSITFIVIPLCTHTHTHTHIW